MKYASSSVTGRSASGRSSIGTFVRRASISRAAAVINSFPRSPVIQSVSRNWRASVSRLLRGLPRAQQIRKQPVSPRNALRQLAIERQSFVDVNAFAGLRHQQTAFLRVLPRIVRLDERFVPRVPTLHESVPALFDPSVEVTRRDFVRPTQQRVLRLQ